LVSERKDFPLPRLRLERQMVGGEHLSESRSGLRFLQATRLSCAAAPVAALRPKETSGTGCRLLWLLSFGQAKESNLPPGNPGLLQA